MLLALVNKLLVLLREGKFSLSRMQHHARIPFRFRLLRQLTQTAGRSHHNAAAPPSQIHKLVLTMMVPAASERTFRHGNPPSGQLRAPSFFYHLPDLVVSVPVQYRSRTRIACQAISRI